MRRFLNFYATMQAPHENGLCYTAFDDKKDIDVLHDLFLLIKNIIQGNAVVSTKNVDQLLEYKIEVSTIQPTLLLVYENRERVQEELPNQNNVNSCTPELNDGTENISSVEVVHPFFDSGSTVILHTIPSLSNKHNVNGTLVPPVIALPAQENHNIVLKQTPVTTSPVIHEMAKNRKISIPRLVGKKTPEKKPEVETSFFSSFCDITFTNVKKIKHEKTHTNLYPCQYCGRVFGKSGVRRIHERTHTGEKPYSCRFCRKTFSQHNNKLVHERTHTGETPFKCRFCGKTFSQQNNKVVHEKTHTGEKPFKCSFCDKSFIEKRRKLMHERVHTGEKPYSCSFCDKTFSQLYRKNLHEKRHTGLDLFSCSICEKTFTIPSKLRRHEQIHMRK